MRLSTVPRILWTRSPQKKSAVALVQSVEDSVQHDLGGSFLTDHQLIFKMPMGHVAQVFVAMHPYLHVLVKKYAVPVSPFCTSSLLILWRICAAMSINVYKEVSEFFQ